jgi:hypothetical protein
MSAAHLWAPAPIDGDDDASPTSGYALSPVRESRTVRAPSGVAPLKTDVPSARPTAMPEPVLSDRPTAMPDQAELGGDAAALASLRSSSQSNRPLSVAIPVRVEGSNLAGLSHRAAFVLMHVDGTSSIGEIAWIAQLPASETIGVFRELLDSGVVEMTGTSRGEIA